MAVCAAAVAVAATAVEVAVEVVAVPAVPVAWAVAGGGMRRPLTAPSCAAAAFWMGLAFCCWRRRGRARCEGFPSLATAKEGKRRYKRLARSRAFRDWAMRRTPRRAVS